MDLKKDAFVYKPVKLQKEQKMVIRKENIFLLSVSVSIDCNHILNIAMVIAEDGLES